ALAAGNQENDDTHYFISGITELTREYDADKEFVASMPEFYEATSAFSADAEEENAENDTYTLQDFQTARLIVRADGNFDDIGALENVSGFEDFHVLQYESPEAAMEAFEK